jgi:hypothetical protein
VFPVEKTWLRQILSNRYDRLVFKPHSKFKTIVVLTSLGYIQKSKFSAPPGIPCRCAFPPSRQIACYATRTHGAQRKNAPTLLRFIDWVGNCFGKTMRILRSFGAQSLTESTRLKFRAPQPLFVESEKSIRGDL